MYVVLFVLTNASNREANKPILPNVVPGRGTSLAHATPSAKPLGCLVGSTVSLLLLQLCYGIWKLSYLIN